MGIEPVAVYELACWLWDHGLDRRARIPGTEGGLPMIKKTAHSGHITGQLIQSFVLLQRVQQVLVDVRSQVDRAVPESLLHHLRRHAGDQEQRRVGVPQSWNRISRRPFRAKKRLVGARPVKAN